MVNISTQLLLSSADTNVENMTNGSFQTLVFHFLNLIGPTEHGRLMGETESASRVLTR